MNWGKKRGIPRCSNRARLRYTDQDRTVWTENCAALVRQHRSSLLDNGARQRPCCSHFTPAVPEAPRQGASCVAPYARNGACTVRGGGSGLNLAMPG